MRAETSGTTVEGWCLPLLRTCRQKCSRALLCYGTASIVPNTPVALQTVRVHSERREKPKAAMAATVQWTYV